MPLHDFECPKCGKIESDVIISIKSLPEELEAVKCPKCKVTMRKVVNKLFTFVLEGEGWTKKY